MPTSQPLHLKDSAYRVEHPETGLSFNLRRNPPTLAAPRAASYYPATRRGRLDVCTAVINALAPEAGYEVVRVDA